VIHPVELRLRSKISQRELDEKVGKIITSADYNVLLTGPAFLRKPDGKPLCVFLPGAMKLQCTPDVYSILHELRKSTTDNRGLAGGTKRAEIPGQTRSRALPVASAIIGSFDPAGAYKYCRLTAWTGQNLPQWRQLQPFLQHVASQLKQYVPDRYAAQMARAQATSSEWVVPGTPFSTVTVNNSYPTGVHTDKGDLDEGFSTIACLRRGTYTGGVLTFPEYRVGVDMHDGDLLLMDAHQWHGNSAMVCSCGQKMNGCCSGCGAERISVVSYFRTAMPTCGTPEQELAKAARQREKTA
jgi:hypothetical protein